MSHPPTTPQTTACRPNNEGMLPRKTGGGGNPRHCLHPLGLLGISQRRVPKPFGDSYVAKLFAAQAIQPQCFCSSPQPPAFGRFIAGVHLAPPGNPVPWQKRLQGRNLLNPSNMLSLPTNTHRCRNMIKNISLAWVGWCGVGVGCMYVYIYIWGHIYIYICIHMFTHWSTCVR